MKKSRWTSYINLDDKSGLVYNALSESFVALPSDTMKALKSGSIESLPTHIQENLKKAGVIIDDDIDEVDALRKLIDKIDNDNSLFFLHVNPTLDCNFNCWYCYENHVKGSAIDETTLKSIENMARRVIETSDNLKVFQLAFFGGEPLLMFEKAVKPLVSAISGFCKDKGVKLQVHFTSNADLLTDDMIDFLRPHKATFQITLDGGRENHDKTRFGKGGTPSFDNILRNVRKLLDNGLTVGLRINFTGENVDSTHEIIDILDSYPEELRQLISVDYQRVWQSGSNSNCDTAYAKARQFRRRLNKAGFATGNNRLIDGVRNSCYGDKRNQVLINFNGDAYCCTARDFKREHRMGHIREDGTVEWEGDCFDQRMSSKFSKPVCQSCRIAPLCGGGCRTQAMEHPDSDECIYRFTEDEIDELIIERFEDRHIK